MFFPAFSYPFGEASCTPGVSDVPRTQGKGEVTYVVIVTTANGFIAISVVGRTQHVNAASPEASYASTHSNRRSVGVVGSSRGEEADSGAEVEVGELGLGSGLARRGPSALCSG